MYHIVCPGCLNEYLVNRKRRKYHSDACRKLHWKKTHKESVNRQQRNLRQKKRASTIM
jgi:hypothetical protein